MVIIHLLLLYFSHPLPKAVLLLCKAVQMSLSPLKGEGLVACLSYCNRASSNMRSSVAVPLTQSGNWLNKVAYQKSPKHQRYCHWLWVLCFFLYLVRCLVSMLGHSGSSCTYNMNTCMHKWEQSKLMWGCVCVCVLSVGGRRWLWCIVVALHDPEPECNVSSVQYRGLPDLHAPATHPTTSYDKLLSFLLWQFVGVSPWVLNTSLKTINQQYCEMNNTPFKWFAKQHFRICLIFHQRGWSFWCVTFYLHWGRVYGRGEAVVMESLVQQLAPSWQVSRGTSVLSEKSHSATDRPNTRYIQCICIMFYNLIAHHYKAWWSVYVRLYQGLFQVSY